MALEQARAPSRGHVRRENRTRTVGGWWRADLWSTVNVLCRRFGDFDSGHTASEIGFCSNDLRRKAAWAAGQSADRSGRPALLAYLIGPRAKVSRAWASVS